MNLCGNITGNLVEKRAENQQLDAQMRDLKKRITELHAAQVGTPCPFCGWELDEEHTSPRFTKHAA